MPYFHPFATLAFHSCDRDVGLKVIAGDEELIPSSNSWDWLGNGIYFWDHNPLRALEYAEESARKTQFNRIPIVTPFVVGAIIELGNCLNLLETKSLQILGDAYIGLREIKEFTGQEMPVNKSDNRALDCDVIKYVHKSRKELGSPPFDTVRCAFPEGIEVFVGSSITSRLHIQLSVLNPESIKGYFLPRPIEVFNPYIRKIEA